MRSIILLLLGVPIPIVILIALVSRKVFPQISKGPTWNGKRSESDLEA